MAERGKDQQEVACALSNGDIADDLSPTQNHPKQPQFSHFALPLRRGRDGHVWNMIKLESCC